MIASPLRPELPNACFAQLAVSQREGLRRLWPVVLAAVLFSLHAAAQPSVQQIGSVLVMSNGNVTLRYNLASARTDFYWQGAKKVAGFYAGVTLSSGYVTGTNYPGRSWSLVNSNQVKVAATGPGLAPMNQYFTLDQPDSFLTRVEMSGASLRANWMSPLIVDTPGGVDLGSYGDDRALFVPFDNDHFVSYNSEGLNGSDTGNEVGAFYDNTSRCGLVAGSVTHDTWKTGVYWSGSNNRLDQLKVFGGLTSHWTWDVMPHGAVIGNLISSPAIFVGFGNDWRTVMESYANENALFVAKRPWANGVPFGWNSWGVTNYQSNLSYANALAVADSIHTNLQAYGFTSGGTVYVNLDSYWDNLWNDYGGTQLINFVNHCHVNGEKAGIYFTPFAFWGSLTDATNYSVPYGFPPNYNLYRFSDILLRDSSGNPLSNDGALALDPTHPGTKGYLSYYAYWFNTWGFDYVKLDFLSHGALEGVHKDPAVTTGIQAYNQGMQYLSSALASKMFISESIAPLFPYQYAHGRRIACDAQSSRISDTAYTMNAVSLGWWISGRLYAFNDPDLLVFDNGPGSFEAQSRLINGAVTGLMLNGSILTNSASISLAQSCLTNAGINAVARVGQTFRPVDGATGTGAANVLVRQDGSTWRLAVFNYTSSATTTTVDLGSAGLPAISWSATDLWSGATVSAFASLSVSLGARQAKLFSLTPLTEPPLIVAQPGPYTSANATYTGVPLTLAVTASGSQPFSYQWFQITNGITNALTGATNSSFTHLAQVSDMAAPLQFFVVVNNAYGSVTSSVAEVTLGNVVAGTPDVISLQFSITNYAGYSGGFFLASRDTAGACAVSNWNVLALTPAGGSGGTQPGVSFRNLLDRKGVVTPVALNVVNVSDGWHQTAATIIGADNANARLMNTFWKTHNDSSPATNVLYTVLTNVPNGSYVVYLYLLQNNPGANGYVYAGTGSSNYFQEFTTFTSGSNFVTAVDTTGATRPLLNYLRLPAVSTGGTNSITLTTVWTSGSDGIGVCGIQLVPPVTLDVVPEAKGQFGLRFPAPTGQSYVVQSSSNLIQWVPVLTNTAANGRVLYVDTNAVGPQRFYRVKQ